MGDTETVDGSTDIKCEILGLWTVVLRSSGRYWTLDGSPEIE